MELLANYSSTLEELKDNFSGTCYARLRNRYGLRLQVLCETGLSVLFKHITSGGDTRVVKAVLRLPRNSGAIPNDELNLQKRLFREAHIMRHLSPRSSGKIPKVRHIEVDGDKSPFFEMNFFNGVRLDQWAFGGRTIEELIMVIKKVALALRIAHEEGIVHRDVKPANILINPSSLDVQLIDFGLAKRVRSDHNLTAVGKRVGTPPFSDPESFVMTGAANNSIAHPGNDIYGLGATLYQLMARKSVLEAMGIECDLTSPGNVFSPEAQINFFRFCMYERGFSALDAPRPEDLSHDFLGVNQELWRIIRKMLAPIKKKKGFEDVRYESMEEVIHDLDSYLESIKTINLWISLIRRAVFDAFKLIKKI